MVRTFTVRDVVAQKDVRISVSRENKDYITIRIGPSESTAGRRLLLELRKAQDLGKTLLEKVASAEERPNHPDPEPSPGDDPLNDDPKVPPPGTPQQKRGR